MIAPEHVPPFIHSIAQLVEPWHSLYSNSKTVGVVVMFAHVGALLLGGGFAVAADRTTLRLWPQDRDAQQRQLTELHAVHRPILAGIVVLLVSGVLMAAADVETYYSSIPFWIKITCVVLLLSNGAFLYKTESALGFAYANIGNQASANASPDRIDGLWRRLRGTSIASLVLWTVTALAGTVLSAAA